MSSDRPRVLVLGLDAASLSVIDPLGLGIPATFPPEPLDGLGGSGFDAPASTGTDARAANDPAPYRRVAERAGRPE